MKRVWCVILVLLVAVGGAACKAKEPVTLRPDAEELTWYLVVYADWLSDGDEQSPNLVACGYDVYPQPDVEVVSADLAFDIVYDSGVTANIVYTGGHVTGAVKLESPLAWPEDVDFTIENVTGTLTVRTKAKFPADVQTPVSP